MKPKQRKRIRKPESPLALTLYIMFWIAILVMFAILFVSQMESYNELQAQLAQTNANIERAQAEQSRLEQQLTFFDNDFYIEQLARERGLVRQNEIVFRNIAE